MLSGLDQGLRPLLCLTLAFGRLKILGLLQCLVTDRHLGIRIESEEQGTVLQRVLLLGKGALDAAGTGGLQDRFDLVLEYKEC